MVGMDKSIKFLPERVSSALIATLKFIFFQVLFLINIYTIFSLFNFNPYLNGFFSYGNFGEHGIIGYLISLLIYLIGFVPTLFLFLTTSRLFLYLSIGIKFNFSLYKLVKFINTLFFGISGIGLVFRNKAFSGIFGYMISKDIYSVFNNFSFLLGVLLLVCFVASAFQILHIKYSDIYFISYFIGNKVSSILSMFIHNKNVLEDKIYQESISTNKKHKFNLNKKKNSIIKKENSKNIIKTVEEPKYKLPDPIFLEQSTLGNNSITTILKMKAVALEAAFEEFGIHGKIVNIKPGPIITLYEYLPNSGIKTEKIISLSEDITRVMRSSKIRMAHIPMTQNIGVEIADKDSKTIRFRSIITDNQFTGSKQKIPLALGVNIGGNPIYVDLAKMPHLLIAGRTGSGKSVFVQSIIMSILYHFTPDKCKLLIIDPKGVDFTLWDGIPSLISPVLTDANSSVNALKWCVREMEDRYVKLKKFGVQNIEGYNEVVSSLKNKGEKKFERIVVGRNEETGEFEYQDKEIDLSIMPYLVIVIDEVADLMSVARKDVEACVQRLAQKARAAGMHLVMATQRPDTTVITGVIKANFPTRISFQARSAIDSGTTLGQKGAEQLLPCGDMLFSEAGRDPVRVHGALIENLEINKVADFLRMQGEPDYVSSIVENEDSSNSYSINSTSFLKEEKNSGLYEQAKEIVIRDKKPTISYLQRRLGIGYNKAATLIEKMEEEGIITKPDATGKRNLL